MAIIIKSTDCAANDVIHIRATALMKPAETKFTLSSPTRLVPYSIPHSRVVYDDVLSRGNLFYKTVKLFAIFIRS